MGSDDVNPCPGCCAILIDFLELTLIGHPIHTISKAVYKSQARDPFYHVYIHTFNLFRAARPCVGRPWK
eukprot:9835697-Karenia_brevis.AAC.1